jgi:hypothetical protein
VLLEARGPKKYSFIYPHTIAKVPCGARAASAERQLQLRTQCSANFDVR